MIANHDTGLLGGEEHLANLRAIERRAGERSPVGVLWEARSVT